MNPKTLKSITRKFNLYRAPECRARTVKNSQNELIVKFEGTGADFYCCYDENFIDYLYYLKDNTGENFRISDVKEANVGVFIVKYELDEDDSNKIPPK